MFRSNLIGILEDQEEKKNCKSYAYRSFELDLFFNVLTLLMWFALKKDIHRQHDRRSRPVQLDDTYSTVEGDSI